jgi:hypothetical protein
MAFLIAQSKQFGFIDHTKTAMIGMVAQAGLALQLKETLLNAIACLDCPPSWNEELMQKLPFFSPAKIQIPILELRNSEFGDQKKTFLENLIYSDRFLVRFKNFPHKDFYPFPKIVWPEQSAQHQNYEFASQTTRLFLQAFLLKDQHAEQQMLEMLNANALPDENVSLTILEAAPPIPTEDQFLTWLRFGDMDKVGEGWNQPQFQKQINQANLFSTVLFLCRDGAQHAFDALDLYVTHFPNDARNRMLYNFLGPHLLQNEPANAVRLFNYYLLQFTDDVFALDKLSDAHLANGDKTQAKETSKRLLSILSALSNPTMEEEALKAKTKKRLQLK